MKSDNPTDKKNNPKKQRANEHRNKNFKKTEATKSRQNRITPIYKLFVFLFLQTEQLPKHKPNNFIKINDDKRKITEQLLKILFKSIYLNRITMHKKSDDLLIYSINKKQ